MFSRTNWRFTAVFTFMLLLVAIDASAQQCPRRTVRLEMIPLGSLGGDGGGSALSVNDLGQVVGQSTLANRTKASFIWDCTRGMRRFPGRGLAELINNRGQVAGTLSRRAFLWSSATGTQLIGAGSPTSLNDAGDVGLGNYNQGIYGSLYTAATGTVSLRSLTGVTWREVFVNKPRQAGGYVFVRREKGDTGSQAGLATWTALRGMRVVDPGGLGGPDDPGISYPLKGFNDRGDMLLDFALRTVTVPFILKNDGTVQYLLPVAEGRRVSAIAFNNHRQVIGLSSEGNRFFLWQPNEFSEIDFLTFGGARDRIVSSARSINNWGWIAATVRATGSTVSDPALLVSVPYDDPNFTNLGRLRGWQLCAALNSLVAMARRTDAACEGQGTQP
jgi:hypothetical protein